CPSGYTSLGGVINSNPAAAVYNSRLYVFARGTDGAIYYQTSTTGSSFSGWQSLGGISLSDPRTFVGSSLFVEVVGSDNNSYRRTTTDGVTFANWTASVSSQAATVPSVLFGTRIYTFVKGTGGNPHLCVTSQ
ncbi:MAG TPA: hypothetical protein PKY82_17155, partial [Pyrinomonadaceae bacterium]|nr:hypothetical protein [Pyrinomonadaceae bacterium]